MKRITKLCALLILLLALQSCDSDDDVTPQVQWEKIEFADQGAIYSIHGSLEDGLLLGTSRAILKLTDNGKVTREVFRVDDQIYNFLKYGDLIYAVSNTQNYISIDEGETWQHTVITFSPSHNQRVYDSKGVIYYNLFLPNGELGTPGLIMRSSDNGTNWENIFPYKHAIPSMHVDTRDRLYLGVSDAKWNGLSFTSDANKAILYYVKK